jgi:hypothetical protein
MHTDEMKSGRLSERVMGCAITAADTLGSGYQLCLLINFGNPRLESKRLVL